MTEFAATPIRFGTFDGGHLKPVVVNAVGGTTAAPAGISDTIIRVYRLFLVVGGATNLTFQDGATALCGPLPLVTSQAIVFDTHGVPWFITSPGNPFNIVLSQSVQLSGTVYYTQLAAGMP